MDLRGLEPGGERRAIDPGFRIEPALGGVEVGELEPCRQVFRLELEGQAQFGLRLGQQLAIETLLGERQVGVGVLARAARALPTRLLDRGGPAFEDEELGGLQGVFRMADALEVVEPDAARQLAANRTLDGLSVAGGLDDVVRPGLDGGGLAALEGWRRRLGRKGEQVGARAGRIAPIERGRGVGRWRRGGRRGWPRRQWEPEGERPARQEETEEKDRRFSHLTGRPKVRAAPGL